MKDTHIGIYLWFFIAIVILIVMTITNVNDSMLEVTEVQNVLPVNEDKELKDPKEVRQYVGAIAEREGLNVRIVDLVVNCESRFDPLVESRTGKFKGLWQIGSMHKIDDSCKLSAVCSTKWAIEKIKKDKSMRAWECYKLTI